MSSHNGSRRSLCDLKKLCEMLKRQGCGGQHLKGEVVLRGRGVGTFEQLEVALQQQRDDVLLKERVANVGTRSIADGVLAADQIQNLLKSKAQGRYITRRHGHFDRYARQFAFYNFLDAATTARDQCGCIDGGSSRHAGTDRGVQRRNMPDHAAVKTGISECLGNEQGRVQFFDG